MMDYLNPTQGPTIQITDGKIEITFDGCTASEEDVIRQLHADLPFWVHTAMNFRAITPEDEAA